MHLPAVHSFDGGRSGCWWDCCTPSTTPPKVCSGDGLPRRTATAVATPAGSAPSTSHRSSRSTKYRTRSALIGFWLLPATPPRLLPHVPMQESVTRCRCPGVGLVEWRDQRSARVGGLVNEYAAMPSLHVGWALWSGWLFYRHARRRVVGDGAR
ncbi:phosphatase PAP2 family protein [Streptomyces sp. NPDC005209]|uniref:phosphatase PAP2 family protein n=1 Tax=Streptomyces sp. NPDC005209 TaxID=3156715 RepID=UPI0033B49F92